MLFSEFVLCTEGGLGLTSNFCSLLRAVFSILLEELLEQQTGTVSIACQLSSVVISGSTEAKEL